MIYLSCRGTLPIDEYLHDCPIIRYSYMIPNTISQALSAIYGYPVTATKFKHIMQFASYNSKLYIILAINNALVILQTGQFESSLQSEIAEVPVW